MSRFTPDRSRNCAQLSRRGRRSVRLSVGKTILHLSAFHDRATIAHALELIEYGIGGGKLLTEKIEQPLFTRRNDELPFVWRSGNDPSYHLNESVSIKVIKMSDRIIEERNPPAKKMLSIRICFCESLKKSVGGT